MPADDLGHDVRLSVAVRRIVSLVPSLTESIAESDGADLLVGCTVWCTHQAELVAQSAKVRGTKNPDIARFVELAPALLHGGPVSGRSAEHQDHGSSRRWASALPIVRSANGGQARLPCREWARPDLSPRSHGA